MKLNKEDLKIISTVQLKIKKSLAKLKLIQKIFTSNIKY